MSRDSNELLYVISAKKEMPWSSFKQNFGYLYHIHVKNCNEEEDKIKNQRLSTVRFLDSLCHCEFDFADNNSKVYVAPPVLVRLPCAGFPQAILAGARNPKNIDRLIDACQYMGQDINIEVTEQGDELVLVPQRVAVQAEDISELQEIASKLAINFMATPSAWALLNFAASLEDYLATRQWVNESELNWKRQTFDSEFLRFSSFFFEKNIAKIRLSQYQHPTRNTQIYYLWQEERCTEVERDWGRYAVLKSQKINVLIYDKHKFIMAVPVGAKLPRLLERALTLCSGYVPKFVEKLPLQKQKLTLNSSLLKTEGVVNSLNVTGFNLFRDVPPQIAEITAAKLGQTLLLQSLNIKL